MPNKHDGKNPDIGRHGTVFQHWGGNQHCKGIRGKVRNLFPFEMEQLKGLPRSCTRLDIPCTSRKEFIMLAWDMDVALEFLRHL